MSNHADVVRLRAVSRRFREGGCVREAIRQADFRAEDIRFDRVGAFQFSFEQGTYSEKLGDPVPSEVKQERWERLMALQQQISLEKNQEQVGKTLEVLIEGQRDGLSVGRSYRDAPEIDGLTIVEGEYPNGEMIPVRITDAMAYDLHGIPESEWSGIISNNTVVNIKVDGDGA